MSGTTSGEEATAPLRAVFRTAVRDVVVLTVVATVLGAVLGGFLVGERGVWGGVLGGAVALLVAGATPVTMLLTARSSLTVAMAAVAGGWLVKTVIVLIAVVLLTDADVVDGRVFAAVVVVGLLGSVAVDARAVAAGRVPYVDPAPPSTGSAPDDVPEG